ncbi:MAG: cupin domain-containing protein [Alphaproteobacteria bacterium]|nr:cupin domain-containing protein [Alphaproteobacteria bacterium]
MATKSKTRRGSKLRGAEKKEAFFRKVEKGIEIFGFARPQDLADGERGNVRLCDGEILRGTVQILPVGFSNTLHYHPAAEGFWMVLSGLVRFYGDDGHFLGEFGPMQGVLIPRNGRYWFHQCGDEEAHLLQVRGSANDGSRNRVDLDEVHALYGKKRMYGVSKTED